MNVLLSIRPEYTEKILSGEKLYEFRKRKPKQRIDKVFIYESSGSRKILGWFSVKKIHSGSPEEIWERCSNEGGIKREAYLDYCNSNKTVYALQIDRIVRFDKPIDPYDMIPDFKPPQSFEYVSDSTFPIESNRKGHDSEWSTIG